MSHVGRQQGPGGVQVAGRGCTTGCSATSSRPWRDPGRQSRPRAPDRPSPPGSARIRMHQASDGDCQHVAGQNARAHTSLAAREALVIADRGVRVSLVRPLEDDRPGQEFHFVAARVLQQRPATRLYVTIASARRAGRGGEGDVRQERRDVSRSVLGVRADIGHRDRPSGGFLARCCFEVVGCGGHVPGAGVTHDPEVLPIPGETGHVRRRKPQASASARARSRYPTAPCGSPC